MCWFPLRPWRLRIANGEFEHIVRCGECPGCLEFDRRRLADRLRARYAHLTVNARATGGGRKLESLRQDQRGARNLFLVRIFAPLSRHAEISNRLHRRPGLALEPGFWRLGVSSFGVLARDPRPCQYALRRQRIECRLEPIRFRRGRRAWRAITAGILVARAAYGEQVKRWYSRGLPKADRRKWEVVKRSYGKGYQRTESPRAWNERRVVLVPPEVWRLRSADRHSVRRLLSRAPDPEGVSKILGLVNRVLSGSEKRSLVIAPRGARPDRLEVMDQLREIAKREPKRTDYLSPRSGSTPPPGGGGYVSSEHSQGELRPKILSDEELAATGASGRPRWQERELEELSNSPARESERRETSSKLLNQALERLRKAMQRSKGDG